MTEILFRRETSDDHLAKGATFCDDMDLVHSPRDGAIVVVAVKHGMHVCWRCGEGFNEGNPKKKRQEVQTGFSRIMLHAGCETRRPMTQVFTNLVRGMQIRRGMAKAAKQSQSVADAAEGAKNKIVL